MKFSSLRIRLEHIACSSSRQHVEISKIHISADLWTSPNKYALLGIVAHWWDEEDVLRSALIALPKLYGAHTGANIGKAIIDTLDLYNISTEKVGYFMLDNSSSNDTAVQLLKSFVIVVYLVLLQPNNLCLDTLDILCAP